MNSFKRLLLQLDEALQKYNPFNYKKLQDPLPSREIDEYMNKLEVDDENFKMLYAWKNGVKARYGAGMRDQIFDFGALVSVQYLLEDSLETQTNPWTKNFIPIIINGDGAALLFNNENGENFGKLHLYCVPLLFIEEPISYYDSIEAMIITTLESYEKKILHYDERENWLNENIDEFYKLAANYNPNSDYWKLPENSTTSPQL
jgi:hypothetical protein